MESSLIGVALAFGSALTLAAANVSVKMACDILTGRAILSLSAALLVLPIIFLVPAPDTPTIRALALSIPAHFAYQICMVRAFERGDLSLVFPIMRGTAPLLTAMFSILLLDEALGFLAWIGLLIVTLAAISFVIPSKGVLLRHHPDKAALLWAAAAAVGIAAYYPIDASGVRHAPHPLTYIAWLFLLDALPITVTAVLLRRDMLCEAIALRWRYGITAGALSVISFGSALYAMSMIEAAKVSAIRESSIVFAALLGSFVLRESFGIRRLISAIGLGFGLILLQVN